MDDERETGRGVSRRKTASNLTFCVKKEYDGKYRKVYAALQKKEDDLTEEDRQLVLNNSDLVKKARESLRKKEEVKARSEEVEDPDEILLPKCIELAAALRNSHHLVVYTGAGISTAAKIPDYRGSNGIWTLLQKGKDIGKHDLSRAEPTLTHMALFELYCKGILKYVVSQNCDGLHLRSGLPKSAVSEVHGNMHLEVCQMCRPSTQYWRMFDVTENTGRFTHRTMRRCHICNSALIDTIVHFGERGNLPWPLNWPSACKAADNADMILCIGSSLKVLKKYPWLWGMDKPVKKRPKLYIINLQWTPKDDQAVLKINGRCDRVMQEVMRCLQLSIPEYSRLRDPIFCHATHLHPEEAHTTSQPELDSPFKKEEIELDNGVDTLKQGFKRLNSNNLSDYPEKMRKVDGETSMVSSIKEETSDFVKSTEICHTFIEKKQDPSEVDHLIMNTQITWLGCEPFSIFASNEEVVGQINSCSDVRNLNDILIDSKENEVIAMSLLGEKKEEDVINSVLSNGQNFSINNLGEALNCSKVNIQTLPVDSSCVDGKENVAVGFSKICTPEIAKPTKKSECDKTSDFSNEQEKILSSKAQGTNKFQTASNGHSSGKGELLADSLNAPKCYKLNGKSSSDTLDEDVGVLKMLQLEHNYSKLIEDSLEEKCLDSKETKKEVLKDLKESRKDPKVDTREKDIKSRKISKDSVQYVDDEEEDDEEGTGKEGNTRQSARISRRVQEKKNAKQQAKTETKRSGDVEKKHSNCSSGAVKSSKVPTPPKNKKLTKADFEMRAELKSRICNFCLTYYSSSVCLFYPSLDFRPRRLEGCICECCDYSSESEDADEEEEGNGDANDGKGDSTDNAEEGTSKSSIINPGWYGKGYRKRFRKRK